MKQQLNPEPSPVNIPAHHIVLHPELLPLTEENRSQQQKFKNKCFCIINQLSDEFQSQFSELSNKNLQNDEISYVYQSLFIIYLKLYVVLKYIEHNFLTDWLYEGVCLSSIIPKIEALAFFEQSYFLFKGYNSINNDKIYLYLLYILLLKDKIIKKIDSLDNCYQPLRLGIPFGTSEKLTDLFGVLGITMKVVDILTRDNSIVTERTRIHEIVIKSYCENINRYTPNHKDNLRLEFFTRCKQYHRTLGGPSIEKSPQRKKPVPFLRSMR